MMVRSVGLGLGLVQQAAYALTAPAAEATSKVMPDAGMVISPVPAQAVASSAWISPPNRWQPQAHIEPTAETKVSVANVQAGSTQPSTKAATAHLPAHLVAVLNRYQVGSTQR